MGYKSLLKNSVLRIALVGAVILVLVSSLTYFTAPTKPIICPTVSIARVVEPKAVVDSYGAEGELHERLLQVEENLQQLAWKVNDRLQKVVDIGNKYPPPSRDLVRQTKADLLQARLDYSKEALKKKKLIRKLATARIMRRLKDRK